MPKDTTSPEHSYPWYDYTNVISAGALLSSSVGSIRASAVGIAGTPSFSSLTVGGGKS